MRLATDRGAPRRLVGVLVGAALAGTVVLGCGASDPDVPAGAQPEPGEVREMADDAPLQAVLIADLGITATALAAHPADRVLLAARRSGEVFAIRLVEEGGYVVPRLDPAPVLDLSGTVTIDGERGLLDLLFARDGRALYASYTDPEGTVTVARFPYDLSTGTVDGDRPTILARVQHPFSGHNGGDLEWLDDDTLLWSLGDSDLTTTIPPAAQDPTDPLGAIVRLDLDATGDGPLSGEDLVGPALVAVGLRNPWRIHRDPATDTLYIGDVGDDTTEEIDTVDLSSTDGSGAAVPNFGWPYFEGSRATEHPGTGPGPFVDPVLERAHAEGVCSIVAGVIGPAELGPLAAGRFLLGDNCSGDVLAFDPGAPPTVVTTVDDGVVAFAEGPDDDVYVLGLSGTVWRLDPAGWDVEAPDLTALDAPPEDPGDTTLAPQQFQAVCDVGLAFDRLGQVGGSPPAEFERVVRNAEATFSAAVPDLPPAVDVAPFRAVFRAALRLGVETGWDTTSPEYEALFRAVTAADPPFEAFPAAITTVNDLGAGC